MCTLACEVTRRNAVLPAAASRSTGSSTPTDPRLRFSAVCARIRRFGETIQRRPLGSTGPYCVPDAAPHVTSLSLLIAGRRAARPSPRSNHRFQHQDASSAEPQHCHQRTGTHQGGAPIRLPEASVGAGPSCLAGGGRRTWGQETLAHAEGRRMDER